ncbi:MAG: hypothetical protein B7Y39_12960 [Bdellovibrio sp. 28-41-41]|nr:MAG: hypothetical protein B7Y39_12960 [Bdellovibrio sp. 28-41-41]
MTFLEKKPPKMQFNGVILLIGADRYLKKGFIMLIQFVAKNYLSFSNVDECIFKMTATSDSRHSNHVANVEGHKLNLLRTAAIYGANAAGKTNLVKALYFLRSLLIKGTQPKSKIALNRFKLNSSSRSEPARFEIEILQEDIHYSYGIVLDEERILEEWLFETKPNGRETMLFERASSKNGESKFEFGARLRESGLDFLSFVAKGTRPEQPFASEAELRNIKQIQPFLNWFRDTLVIIPADSKYKPLEMRIHQDQEFANHLGNFLRAAGTGIESIGSASEDLEFAKHFPGMSDDLKQQILSTLDGKNAVMIDSGKGPSSNDLKIITGTIDKPILIKLNTIHKGLDGKEVSFSFKDESSGTQRLIHLFPVLFSLKQSKKVYVVDELERSLHPLLSRLFISTFLDSAVTRNQLIFSTHEECLLDLDLLRRDEIWFMEKGPDQASKCYPLTEFKIRPDLEIRKGYLAGRFGAIPFFGDLSFSEQAE